jgi:YgiT-type zinc finger domain-containing protein
MIPFDKCPVCGGDLVRKKVEKLLSGGVNTAVISVRAEVCLRCGERLYDKKTIGDFENIRYKLKFNKTSGFKELGHAYKVAV